MTEAGERLIRAAKQAREGAHSCACIGPQNGEPLCPCRMRGVTIKDGRYVRIEDLGPAPSPEERLRRRQIWDQFNTSHWSKDEPAQKCLHEELDESDPSMRGKPRMLSCNCPKCSPRC